MGEACDSVCKFLTASAVTSETNFNVNNYVQMLRDCQLSTIISAAEEFGSGLGLG